ncbi:S8 family serine peptidase [Olleya aquimaris]|uniref:Putative secreted protein (Por secretion system target) n=1 Tax=Olleya aquimaris TaxID=639310 RepID=A0A327RA41_9FLAO|nr:S8 family serine peptidase [Olleya aquimaris]RAJ12985.1 putative secreted protein (Por secretion system target) [Olleya aquimaris]
MKKLLLVFIFIYSSIGLSQEHAWVYLTDKPNSSSALANPNSILTQKALDRKAAHNVAVDFRDVPVDESYITAIKSQPGVSVMAKSKWFNALHVVGDPADINALSTVTVNGNIIVSSIDFADDNLNTRTSQNQDKHEVEASLTTFNYGSAANQIEMINGDDLHQHPDSYTGTGMTIAVLDAGFPDVDTMNGFQRLRDAGGILGGYDFVDRTSDVYIYQGNSHGTWVLSDMAGFIQDQFVGTAPDANYYLFRTENAASETPLEESLWVEAAERADSLGVDVINSSLGYTTYDNPNYSYTPADMDGNTAYITKGANIAFEKGILVVNSAGNSGGGSWQIVGAPADAAGVFSVGAVKPDGTYASFSSQGNSTQPTQKPDVVAQGQASYVILNNDTITTLNGTSFSAPILAGGIVCLWQALPTLSNAEIMQLVRESASQYNAPDNLLGYGIPDLSIALAQGLSIVEFQNQNTTLKIYPNPVKNQLTFEIPSQYEQASVKIYDILGKKVIETTVTSMQQNINTATLAKGVYLVKIEANDLSLTKKIIKN